MFGKSWEERLVEAWATQDAGADGAERRRGLRVRPAGPARQHRRHPDGGFRPDWRFRPLRRRIPRCRCADREIPPAASPMRPAWCARSRRSRRPCRRPRRSSSASHRNPFFNPPCRIPSGVHSATSRAHREDRHGSPDRTVARPAVRIRGAPPCLARSTPPVWRRRTSPLFCPHTQLTHAQPVDLPSALSVQGRNLADTSHIASASIAETANAASPLFEPGSRHAIHGGFRLRM